MKQKRNILSSIAVAIVLATGMCGITARAEAMPEPVAAAQGGIAAPSAQMKAMAGGIELTVTADEPVRFYIYSITGQIVRTVDVAAGTVTVELPKGLYIVKCSQWSRQTVVK